MQEPVYIISGFMRTGTSMMMKALEVGGLETVKRQSREDMRIRYKDEFYDPNEGGLYELETADYQKKGFPKEFKGKLVKVLNAGNASMSVCLKKIIYMRRDPEEIRQSYQAFFDKELTRKKEDLEQIFINNIELLENRKDVDLITLWYRDVINNPRKSFQLIKDNGWPIDVDKCVEVVNPELYRFRKENLIEGII